MSQTKKKKKKKKKNPLMKIEGGILPGEE